jgi:hypothetical protein
LRRSRNRPRLIPAISLASFISATGVEDECSGMNDIIDNPGWQCEGLECQRVESGKFQPQCSTNARTCCEGDGHLGCGPVQFGSRVSTP